MDIAEKINNLTMEGFDTHLVTCGMCGGILNQVVCRSPHKVYENAGGDITCPYCKFAGKCGDFPDLFY